MKIDIQKIYKDHNIKIAPNDHKHARAGWLQVECPFCSGNPGYHLGYNMYDDFFNCWRCGYKTKQQALSKLLNISTKKTNQLLYQYRISGKRKPQRTKQEISKEEFKMPACVSITESKKAMQYMKNRGFSDEDIKKLETVYCLKSTNHLAYIDKIDLRFRILAPIFHNLNIRASANISAKRIMSWQTRDYTGMAKLKYITCPKKIERIHHKDMLYSAPDPDMYESVVLCEGIFDVWKLYLSGFPATCGFGVELKDAQILQLKQYKKVYIFLDPDSAGQKKCDELEKRLNFMGIDCVWVLNPYRKDPGDLTKESIKKCFENIYNFN